jgi:uncharacterized membrane protein YhaH (DUF805 family)
MTFTDAVRSGFSNYVTFSGRARRSEFWFWFLFAIIAGVVAAVLDSMLFPAMMDVQTEMGDGVASFSAQGGPISALVSLGLFLPGLAVAVRRLHDVDRSGWWFLLAFIPLIGIIVLIVWWATEGTRGPNRFGSDPKA